MKYLKRILIGIIILSVFWFVDNLSVNASTVDWRVTLNGTRLTTQDWMLTNTNANNNFKVYNNIAIDDITLTPSYGLVGVCTTGRINNISQSGSKMNDLQLYRTNQVCTLNNVFDYTGTVTYISFAIPSTSYNCSVNATSCVIELNIGAYWNLGGYAQLYTLDLSDTQFVYDSTNDTIINQNQTQINQNNQIIQGQDQIKDSITSDEGPSKLDALENSAGWLPPGPVDSILNLPLSLLNNLSTNLGKACQPANLPLPFGVGTITLPCLNTIYDQIEGLNVWINTISLIAAAFILYSYLLKLYSWVDGVLTMRENTWNDKDQWGGL